MNTTTNNNVSHAELDMPLHFLLSQLVYATGRQQVSDVWAAGKPKLRERVRVDIGLDEVLVKARQWQGRIGAVR